jgi:hypothetical protein
MVDGNGCNTDCRESGSVAWSVSFAGADGGRDTAWGVVFLGSGDVVAVGAEDFEGSEDMLMVRLAGADGAEVWTWRSGGPGTDRIEDVTINAVGQIVAGGIHVSAPEGDAAWVGVFDGTGTLLFDDHPAGDIVTGVTGNAAGFIVAGSGDGADEDGFVASYHEGAQQAVWHASSGLVGDDVYIDLDRITDDDVLVVGWADGGSFVHRVVDAQVEVLSMLDPSEGPLQVQGAALHDPSGDLVVAGLVTTAFAHDAWLGRLTADGSEVWSVVERDVDLEVDEEFEGVVVDAEGNLVAAGFRTGDDKDAWVRKYDPSGVLMWSRAFDAPGDSVARAVDADGDGNVTVAGETQGTDGTLDFWVAKLAR